MVNDDPNTVKKYLQEALQDYPNHVFFLQLLAIAEYKIGDRDEALAVAKKAHTLFPNQDTLYIYTQIVNNIEIIMKK